MTYSRIEASKNDGIWRYGGYNACYSYTATLLESRGGSGSIALSFILGSTLSLHAYRVNNIKKAEDYLENESKERDG